MFKTVSNFRRNMKILKKLKQIEKIGLNNIKIFNKAINNSLTNSKFIYSFSLAKSKVIYIKRLFYSLINEYFIRTLQ